MMTIPSLIEEVRYKKYLKRRYSLQRKSTSETVVSEKSVAIDTDRDCVLGDISLACVCVY